MTTASNSDRIRDEIASLRKKIKLSESEEEIMVMTDQINSLMEKLKTINRKDPVVVPIKDAKTIGDKMERKLKSKNIESKMKHGSVLI